MTSEYKDEDTPVFTPESVEEDTGLDILALAEQKMREMRDEIDAEDEWHQHLYELDDDEYAELNFHTD